MTTLTAFGKPVEGLDALIDTYPPDEFASPQRSTLLLIDYWRRPQDRVREFVEILGETADQSWAFHFEHRVPVQKGRGKPSHTDLVVMGNDTAIGIEAKYTEPRYEVTAEWLGGETEGNRIRVLNGWLDLIREKTGSSISWQDVAEVPYQMIHRTASACAFPSHDGHVVYQLFGSGDTDHYVADLRRLSSWISSGALRFSLVKCPFTPSARYRDLVDRWKREGSIAESVIAALKNGPLVDFGRPERTEVS